MLVRTMLQEGNCNAMGFEVVAASNVRDALGHIVGRPIRRPSLRPAPASSQEMALPQAGSAPCVITPTRMRLTVVSQRVPGSGGGMSAILAQADEIFTKPIRIGALKELIRHSTRQPAR